MNCKKIERWVSDELDGALAPDKKQRVARHLATCRACREFQRTAQLIQTESRRVDVPAVSPEHLEALSGRVWDRIRREKGAPGEGRWAIFRGLRWAWLAAPVALALVVSVFLSPSRVGPPPDDVFSIEGCFDRVVREIAGDEELAAGFGSFLEESLAQEESLLFFSDGSALWNEPDFWISLSEEALGWLEDEIKEEIRS